MVTNHYTPIQNIVLNIKNLFGIKLPIVVQNYENKGIEIHSSKFINVDSMLSTITEIVYRSTSLFDYINANGLTSFYIVNVGQYLVLYVLPNDVSIEIPKNAKKINVY